MTLRFQKKMYSIIFAPVSQDKAYAYIPKQSQNISKKHRRIYCKREIKREYDREYQEIIEEIMKENVEKDVKKKRRKRRGGKTWRKDVEERRRGKTWRKTGKKREKNEKTLTST